MIAILKCSALKMESHTLEILQQGVWASLTGGWFYDLRQNVFCNTFHLYLWLFLLCFPFILHLYFLPSVIIFSFYCGTIGFLFTVIKLLNYRLHKMFDTTKSIQEIMPEDGLSESQRKGAQNNINTQNNLEDNGIELQILNDGNVTNLICKDILKKPIDEDSIISLDAKIKTEYSTIDLEVDVHRKNSSVSSELSINLMNEMDVNFANEGVLDDPVKELLSNTTGTECCNLTNSSLRLKEDENVGRFEEDDFVLSQSDCYIAKQRKKSMEDLSKEYKLSQSDCHISKLRIGLSRKSDAKDTANLSSSVQSCVNIKDPPTRKHCKDLSKHLNRDFQPGFNLNDIENNQSFNEGNFVSDGSCEILTLNQSGNKDLIKYAGSLESPLREIEHATGIEKGLLYWKQKNLGKTKKEKFNDSQNVPFNNYKIGSVLSIHSLDNQRVEDLKHKLDKDLEHNSTENLEKFTCYCKENVMQNSELKENSILKILEENFDWCDGEFQNKNSDILSKIKVTERNAEKHKSDERIKEKASVVGESKCGLKFQIDSDEELSDNRGSQSPLLCRHESLKKSNSSSTNYLFSEIRGRKIHRSFSGEESYSFSFNKINRTLSVDENMVLLNKIKNGKNTAALEKNSFSSFLLAVYGDQGKVCSKDIDSENGIGVRKCDDSYAPLDSVVQEPEMENYADAKSNQSDDLFIAQKKSSYKETNHETGDVWERKGLHWLLERTDVGALIPHVQNEYSCKKELPTTGSSCRQNIISLPNRGAIPKTKITQIEKSHSSKTGNRKNLALKDVSYEFLEKRKPKDLMEMNRSKMEKENGIIDKEGGDFTQSNCENSSVTEETQSSSRKDGLCREAYDSSNSSTELSSLLPLSSLLSSLHPPNSPLLAAFLATRKELSENALLTPVGNENSLKKSVAIKEEKVHQNVAFVRNRHKRNKKSSRPSRNSRSVRVSSLPLVALASVVSTNPGLHLATSYDDTSQGAVHCFQDERGNWRSYTFDSQITSPNHVCVSVRKFDNLALNEDGLINVKSKECGENTPNKCNTKYIQTVAQSNYVQLSVKKEKDFGFMNLINTLPIEESYRNQSQISEQKKLNQAQKKSNDNEHAMIKSKKLSETWDSTINLVSNSNSENESSLSLNSTIVSPSVDVSVMRPSFSNFVRERLVVNQRNLLPIRNGSSNIFKPEPNSDSALLQSSEYSNDDANNANNGNNNNFNECCIRNNKSINNNNNNNKNINMNNNGNNDNSIGGHESEFYSEGMINSVSMRSPFGLIAETFFERNCQETAAFHASTMPQDSQLPVSFVRHGNEPESGRNHFGLFDLADLDTNADVQSKPRHYYKFYYTPWNYVKIRFDRLELLALLDRNLTVSEICLSLFLSVTVSVCGIILLNYGFYRDLFAFLFCFALAGCQYSLLKSVQPDATSPTHGYNRVVIYSRSIYFCVTSLLIFVLTTYLNKKPNISFQFYNIHFSNNTLIRVVRDGLVNLLLFFPILFTLGFFPQINTFCLYLLEQVDMHMFGGNAMSSLAGALYCVLRSVITAIFIYGFAYGALSEAKTSQHILYSIFTALLISLSYHLSRSSSNPNLMWKILKDYLFQDELREKYFSSKLDGNINKTSETDKSVNGLLKSKEGNRTNNLLRNSNPSSFEICKGMNDKLKSNLNGTFENSGSVSGNLTDGKKERDKELVDPLPEKLKQTVNARLKNDVIVCSFVAVLVFGIHSSTVFTSLQPDLNPILWGIAGCSGIILHYIVPELRKHLPWLCLARPVLKCHEHAQFEVKNAAKIMWFEETYFILRFLERNLLYPVIVLASLTYDGPRICKKFGVPFGAFVTSVCGLKIMRSAFSNTSQQYLVVIFSALLFEFDYYSCSETFLVDYFVMGIIFSKTYEFLLKIQFVVIYIAPWQITWGSAFHAFAQPFSVPHSAMLFIQAAISAVLSAPLNPFLGSAIFLASYVRPVKFWERDYNTKRVDHSNTRMSSHLERNLGSDDNNLNSIFYEHLTRSLQHSLCGDLELGRWGSVYQGDCFVLASDYLNCLVHIIEMGNGLVTFQMRGLEFRGTYCQQREVEAISERVEDDDGCCCCEPCHIPHILSVNAAFSKRWLAWEVTASKYVLEGYSISDNSAASTLQVFDFRKVLVTYYVKSIIFYCIRSPKLQSWLTNPTILTALEPLADRSFVDLDPVFNINIDQDFDARAEGITRNSFCTVYLDWIQYCCSKRDELIDKSLDSSLISLCLALSLIGRRTLGTASHNTVSSVEFFLYGLHALFKGDFRITSIRDDWIFTDMEFLMKVVAPGVRMSLKLHQDHFMSPEEYEDPSALFDAISNHENNLVISHEGDPAWRSAVLSGIPSLLALRHVLDDGSDEYKIIMLNKRFLSFRVIKLNRECVRGLWAGQQQELVFLRNRNPERGSIQNAKQVLRNMINSSCDQPIGYPIYVSPLTTSYSDTNKQISGILGGPLSLQRIKGAALKIWRRIGERCREGCSSGSVVNADEGGCSFGHEGIYAMTNVNIHSGYGQNTTGSQSMDSSQLQLGSSNRGGSLGRSSAGGRGSVPSVGKPSGTTLASLAGLLSSAELPKGECFLRERETSFTFIKEKQNREEKDTIKRLDERRDDKDKKREDREIRREREKILGQASLDNHDNRREVETIYQRVRIVHPNLVFDAINLGRRIDVTWPDEGMRLKGGRSYWKDWLPDSGMEGQVVHKWIPNHRDPAKRSNVDKTILLVKVDDKFVPIAEAGVQDLGMEV